MASCYNWCTECFSLATYTQQLGKKPYEWLGLLQSIALVLAVFFFLQPSHLPNSACLRKQH